MRETLATFFLIIIIAAACDPKGFGKNVGNSYVKMKEGFIESTRPTGDKP